jgi:hypothetical protein
VAFEPSPPRERYISDANIIYTAAVTTKEVVMRLSVIVVMGLMALYGYLLYEPMLFKEIEGIIDRSSRKGGIHPLQGLIDLLGSGMSLIVLEKREDGRTLNSQEDPPPLESCLFLFEGHLPHEIFLARKNFFVKN